MDKLIMLISLILGLVGLSAAQDIPYELQQSSIVQERARRSELERSQGPCPRRQPSTLSQFCDELEDGNYYDPWNPTCGYIECEGGEGAHRVCAVSYWNGLKQLGTEGLDMMAPKLCQKPYPEEFRCMYKTLFSDFCRNIATNFMGVEMDSL